MDDGDKIENRVGPFGRSFTPNEVKSLVEDNIEFLEKYDKEAFNPKAKEALFKELDELQARADAFPDLERPLVVENFDDKFQKRECVYGIVRDSTRKRITISFRGTENKLALVSNWLSNFSIAKKTVDVPDVLKEVDVLKGDSLYLHTGFHSEY